MTILPRQVAKFGNKDATVSRFRRLAKAKCPDNLAGRHIFRPHPHAGAIGHSNPIAYPRTEYDFIGETAMTTPFANFAIATAAIVSPLWLDWLTKVSSGAGLLLPIAGLLLALLQIVRLLKDWKKKS